MSYPDRVCAICGRAGVLDGDDLTSAPQRLIWKSRARLDSITVERGRPICVYHFPDCRPLPDPVLEFKAARLRTSKPAPAIEPEPVPVVYRGRRRS